MNDDDSLAAECPRIQAGSFVESIEHHTQIDSTNNRAVMLVNRGELFATTLVLADQQTSGRGRGANSWWSGPGGLTFSVAIPAAQLKLPERRWPQISLATAVAICQVFKNVAPQAEYRVKWPNDVFANGRKIAGILVEAPQAASGKRAVVVGIGLNVNNSWSIAPEALRHVGTSLCDLTDGQHDRAELLVQILAAMDGVLNQLRNDDEALPHTWQTLCLLRGQTIEVDTTSRIVAGVCAGIGTDGALRINIGDTLETVRLYGGVVRIVTSPLH